MLRALARSTHPGPTVAVTLIACALAWGAGLDGWRVAVVTVMILLNQISVGLSNDWLDVARDRRTGRTDKPIASGEVSTRLVATIAIVSAVASVGLSLTLGPLAALAHAVFLASGWFYNLGLKSTAASVVPYITGFGALPAIVTLAAQPPHLAAAWVIAAGSLLGVAAHFSNVLPDLEDDRETGVRGLPHYLGSRASGIIIAVSLVAASLTIVFGPGTPPTIVGYLGVAAILAIAVVSLTLIARNIMKRMLFRLSIAAALISVVLLLLSAPQLS
ncbi:UbiA family prenyltransferase [Salinibacterium sp. NG22]|uniref:UbiA family prenyltransferase n=1 Tax=unclassified Salinibacterium TaxID=2632331 RepID=UPI0018CECF94|nr:MULTISPECIES: UbiA family prenyltransferase [unclassified Salinibacterium]MBH0023908.1 UbiA family prenyltransferase [Salinibacterium sp. SWN248]MBH0109063.1 UbiA family prenyltransferase [Salinibacterium sp. NG22]